MAKVWQVAYKKVVVPENLVDGHNDQLIEAVQGYLADGWEPFAVVHCASPAPGVIPVPHTEMWFRRQVVA